MARKRVIAPSIWEDPSFNKLSIVARLAFIGLISNADDDGYLRGECGSIKRLVFGFDEMTEYDWYGELQNYKNLHFFEENGEEFVHIVKWEKHQVQREDRKVPSIYPKCPLCQADDGQLPAEEKGSKVKLREEEDTAFSFKTIQANPLWPSIKAKFPDRDYEYQFNLMIDWWRNKKKRLPKNISAFVNWLEKTKPDEELIARRRREFEDEQDRKRQAEIAGAKEPKPETLKDLRDRIKTFKGNFAK